MVQKRYKNYSKGVKTMCRPQHTLVSDEAQDNASRNRAAHGQPVDNRETIVPDIAFLKRTSGHKASNP